MVARSSSCAIGLPGGPTGGRGRRGATALQCAAASYGGQSSADNLPSYATQGGFPIALENLYRTANPPVQQIADNWRAWRQGVPAH